MQWSVIIGGKEHRLNLPRNIVDDIAFDVDVDGNSIRLRWIKSLRTFFLIEQGLNGRPFERPLPIRSLFVTKDADDGKSSVSLEISSGNPSVVAAKVGRYVFGQENRDKSAQAKGATIRSPMTGKILQVLVKNDDIVTVGATLFIIEAMKMENKILASAAGSVGGITVVEGDQVQVNQTLAKIVNEVTQ